MSYDPEQRTALQDEMKHFQRVMQARRKGWKYKARQRMVRRPDGTLLPLFDVFLCDVTRGGRDSSLGDPILIDGPFLSPEEADAVARDHEVGKKVFYFGPRAPNLNLTPPKSDK